MTRTNTAVTFGDHILHHALTQPDKPAIILADRIVTYGMLAQGVKFAEREIRALGVEPGGLVCVAVQNPLKHLVVGAALFRLGHPMLSVHRSANVESHDLPIAMFLEDPDATPLPDKPHAFVTDEWFTGAAELVSARSAGGHPSDDALCRVVLSSGTTGQPKAIAFSLADFNTRLMAYYLTVDQGNWDRLLCSTALTSNWGFLTAAHVLFAGKTLYFAASPRSILSLIALYNIEVLVVSAHQLYEIVREQARASVPTPSLRAIMTGGSTVSTALMAEARTRLCSQLLSHYGSTEAGATAFAPADSLEGIEGAAGFVAPWATVEVIDDNGGILPPGTNGHLRIRNERMGQPYFARQNSTSFKDGWFYPFDTGRVREDGLLILAGRASEVINARGLKILPDVIEEVVRNHPAVGDVAAVGIANAHGVEEVALAIVATMTFDAQELVAWCAQRGVPVAKIFTVKALPRTELGKLRRDEIKRSLLSYAVPT